MVGRSKGSGRYLVVPAIIVAVLFTASMSSAQLGLFPTPTPKRTATPAPTLTQPPGNQTPTPEPMPSGILPPPKVTATPKATKSPKPGETKEPVVDDLAELPDALEDFVVPSFPRTRPRNTVDLVNALRELTDLGVPLETALIEGMGRFPVAGLAHYYDDWLNPRFTPKPHLHHGLDIFADFGTPIRAPDEGVVTSLPSHGAGGIAVWMRGSDGTSYYFAHMLERVEGIAVGQRVEIGTVLGFVGDTGNAAGGTPHMHFEIHPGGGAAVPPKPTVDEWLDEAERIAPRWVKARQEDVKTKGRILGSSNPTEDGEEVEASMLLTLLDPVGGSVGLLPTLQVQPRRSGGAVSDRLLDDLIRRRVGGHIFLPSSATRIGD